MLRPSLFHDDFDLIDRLDSFPWFDDREFKNLEKKLYGHRAKNVMNTDIRETDDAYKMEIDLPGFKKEDVTVQLDNGYLLISAEKGLDKILKKVGEESTEVIIAGKAEDKKDTIYEIADLAYHVMVLMVEMGISLEDIHRELQSRHVIDHKIKQEKMT